MMEQTQTNQNQQQQKPQQFIQPLFQDAFSKNLIRDILNPEEVIEFIENTLRGYKLNNEGEWEKKEGVKPLKEQGIIKIVVILRSHLPKNQTLANLQENDVIRMAREIRLNIIEEIHQNWEDFTYEDETPDEPDLSLCDQIVLLIDHNVFANLTRAKDGRENTLLRTIYRLTDQGTVIERTLENQSSGNIFSNLFKRKIPQNQNQAGGYPQP